MFCDRLHQQLTGAVVVAPVQVDHRQVVARLGQCRVIANQCFIEQDGPIRFAAHLVGIGGEKTGLRILGILQQQFLAALRCARELFLLDQQLQLRVRIRNAHCAGKLQTQIKDQIAAHL